MQVENRVPPTQSRSGHLIKNHPVYTVHPLIGFQAPTLKDVTAGRKRKLKMSAKKTTLSGAVSGIS